MKKFGIYFLYLSIILEPVMGVKLSPIPGLSIKNTAFYILILALIAGNASSGRPILAWSKLNIPIIIYLVYIVLSMVMTSNFGGIPGYYLGAEIIYIKMTIESYMIFFVGYNLFHNKKDLLDVIGSQLVMLFVLNMITILSTYGLISIERIIVEKGGRTTGAFGEQNQYAAYVVLFIPYAIMAAMMSKNMMKKAFYAVVVITALFTVLLTGSRGGMLAIILGVCSLVTLQARKVTPAIVGRLLAVSVLFALFSTVVFLVLPEESQLGIIDNVVGRAEDQSLDDYSSGRMDFWPLLLGMFMESPLWGTGWHTVNQLTGYNSHNDFLLVLTEGGMIGFILFCLIFKLFVSGAKRARPLWSENRWIYNTFIAGIYSILLAMFFVNLYLPYLFVFLYAGLVLKLATLEIRDYVRAQRLDAAGVG